MKKIIGVVFVVIFAGGLLFGCNRNTTYKDEEVLKNQEVNQGHSIEEDTQMGVVDKENNRLQNNEGNDNKQIESSLNENLFIPNFENINKLLKLNKEAVINWLGNEYEIKAAGAEGQEKGYYFEQHGLMIVFDEDNTLMITSAYCDQKVDINGARLGMTFSDIQEKLGVTEIGKLNVFEPNQSNYAIIYDFGDWHVWFGADENNSPTTALQIRNWRFMGN
ncbi:MAG: hypothetical protein BWY74_02864 [Firmicutes bacterium ADurb.Bin419]|nr:MAG: hypothetical protein BWY74_02864 [Firmicutes bacterium ADurb.Bin419]